MIRRIRLDEVGAVSDLYVHEYAHELGDSGKPAIEVWLQNCALHPKAFCLIAEEADAITGFVIASLRESHVMPGLAGELYELWARNGDEPCRSALAREAIARLRALGARTIRFDSSDETHAPLFEGLGFKADSVRYSLYDE